MGGTRLRIVVASLLLSTSMAAGTAVAAPPPPPNPSDDQLGASRADANTRATEVGQLTNQVAQAEAQLDQLQADVELKMEDANRALVDLQLAQDEAARAKAEADAARAAADGASKDITDARADVDRFAAASYRQGTEIGSMSAYIGSKNPDDLLARAQLLAAVGSSQLDALDAMEVARTEKANKDSTARQALDVANQKQAAASAAKDAADAATAVAQAAQDSQAAATQQLEARKSSAESALAAAQSTVSGLAGQRQAYLNWLAARQAEDAAQNQPPPGTGGGQPSAAAPPPSSGGAQAVIDRAMSQLGVPYAWGGGNASGPTRGIHDGGVADAHGDYDKVGFDCSGLMIYAFAAVGKRLPHYSGYQATAGRRVPLSQKAPGDMLFWATQGHIHHVALYIGGDRMVEAPYSGSHVRVAAVRYGGIVGYATRLL
ncbi:NlpC/P60 family protein [Actinophytocola oryzae]|uniref:Cell wall-associated NlpC family hydrolase n=1 Tax=Actinophytocola oryzae TaxID=502181 RepID=A0A4R7V263_9PSEU|nr:NlpC/P60 family protein [Actinophytocola oryzae]TDV42642.1 cell wall-associated NlpC family hydrolase [Actinophytocola oryzae]